MGPATGSNDRRGVEDRSTHEDPLSVCTLIFPEGQAQWGLLAKGGGKRGPRWYCMSLLEGRAPTVADGIYGMVQRAAMYVICAAVQQVSVRCVRCVWHPHGWSNGWGGGTHYAHGRERAVRVWKRGGRTGQGLTNDRIQRNKRASKTAAPTARQDGQQQQAHLS
jgi:hypothetical protein